MCQCATPLSAFYFANNREMESSTAMAWGPAREQHGADLGSGGDGWRLRFISFACEALLHLGFSQRSPVWKLVLTTAGMPSGAVEFRTFRITLPVQLPHSTVTRQHQLAQLLQVELMLIPGSWTFTEGISSIWKEQSSN